MSAGMYDVAIIGGGSAGRNAAILLAKTGRQVIVFEREKFPRFHIGESLVFFSVISCATVSHHEFSEPTNGWQTKSGQLMYRTPNTTLIGEALVRFSRAGDFELTVSKGPGVTLLSVRQDATFAEVKGGLARQGWSGPVGQAPPQLRGWLGLQDQSLHAPEQKTLRYASGNET